VAPANLNENAPEPQISSRPEPQRESQVRSQPEPHVQAGPQDSLAQSAVAETATPIERLKSAVLQALTDGNQRILVSMLEAGEWTVEGNELVIKVSESQTVVDMSLGADGRRLAVASASGVLGRAVKLKIIPGAAVAATEVKHNGAGRTSGASLRAGGRNRASRIW
jgi:hypothetical protein